MDKNEMEQKFKKAMEQYAKDNYAEALPVLEALAEQGHAGAQCYLGLHYKFCWGAEQNEVKGLKLLHKAARQGYAEAQYRIGINYYKIQSSSDYLENIIGAKWFRKAAEQGHVDAMYHLGFFYCEGEERIEWLFKAADGGSEDALFDLGDCYERGYVVAKDPAKAAEYYRKAADKGHPLALEKVTGDKRHTAFLEPMVNALGGGRDHKATEPDTVYKWKPRKMKPPNVMESEDFYEILKMEVDMGYNILKDADDNLLFSLYEYDGEPEKPHIEYSGQYHALFHRRPDQTIILTYINPDVQSALNKSSQVLVAESLPGKDPKTLPSLESQNIVRDYKVAVSHVSKLSVDFTDNQADDF